MRYALICGLALLVSSCVIVTGRDKTVLDTTYVWAYSVHQVVKEQVTNNKPLNTQQILQILENNRDMWAYFVGASEGKTKEDILGELQLDKVEAKWVKEGSEWEKVQ